MSTAADKNEPEYASLTQCVWGLMEEDEVIICPYAVKHGEYCQKCLIARMVNALNQIRID